MKNEKGQEAHIKLLEKLIIADIAVVVAVVGWLFNHKADLNLTLVIAVFFAIITLGFVAHVMWLKIMGLIEELKNG